MMLKRRSELSAAEGFLVDYWLFLHCDDTHPMWCARPVGSKFLASMALSMSGGHHRTLLRSISVELTALSALNPFFPNPCPTQSPIYPNSSQITTTWKDWLKASLDFRSQFLDNLLSAIQHAVDVQDYLGIAFLLRRLASELADDDLSRGSLVSLATNAFLSCDGVDSLKDKMRRAFRPSNQSYYIVKFLVSPVQVPNRIAQHTLKPGVTTRFIVEGIKGDRKELIGLQARIRAYNSRQAVILAMPVIRGALHHLRLRYYIHTSLRSPVEVASENVPDSKEYLPLANPFWTSGWGLRRIPRLPGDSVILASKLPPDAGSRWNAATWHIAAALGNWSEDIHSASSEVWQALEAFSGGRQQVKSGIVNRYLKRLPLIILEHLASKINYQAAVIRRKQASCDWFQWNRKTQMIEEWAHSILHRSSHHYAGRWRHPYTPLIVYRQRVGLVKTWYDVCSSREVLEWAERRLTWDFDLLYGLRNASVHEGLRVGNEQLAAYLGRLGLQVLYDDMGENARSMLAKTYSYENSEPSEEVELWEEENQIGHQADL